MRVVEEQIQDLDVQMQDLDDFVSRAKSHNANHHERHNESVQGLNTTVEQSFNNISGHFKETFGRVQTLGEEMKADAETLENALEPLDENICQPLSELRDSVQKTELAEYEPTGESPEKTKYDYPTELPRTDAHELLLAAMRESPTRNSSNNSPYPPSTIVLPDINLTPVRSPTRPATSDSHHSEGLREVDPNLASATKATTGGAVMMFDAAPNMLSPSPAAAGAGAGGEIATPLPLLKPTTNARARASRLAKRVGGMGAVAEGAENLPPPAMRSSTRRKSPRLR